METGRSTEAVGQFRRADAMSNGENVAIRNNLRFALENLERSGSVAAENNNNYRLVRRGTTEFVIEAAP